MAEIRHLAGDRPQKIQPLEIAILLGWTRSGILVVIPTKTPNRLRLLGFSDGRDRRAAHRDRPYRRGVPVTELPVLTEKPLKTA